MTTLRELISDLSNTFKEGYGIEVTEDALFKIIDMIRVDQERKVEFLDMVERSFMERDPSGLCKNGIPRELVELATHELRWPEFATLADKRLHSIFGGDEQLAASDVSQGIKRAYADDWEDREFFQRYTD